MVFNDGLQILIVEDNTVYAQMVEYILKEAGLRKLHIAANYEDGLEQFNVYAPDLCVFDIDLGNAKKTGVHLAEKIRESNATVPIIFLTSHFSEDFYELCRYTRPSCFLSKEISQFKLQLAVDLALNTSPFPDRAPMERAPYISTNNFFFKVGDVYKSIPVKDVSYFFSDQKLTYARVGTRNFPTSVQLKILEHEFGAQFARIHKSYLVNISLIDSIHPGENSVGIQGETLPIGYAYKKPFLDQLKLLK